MSLKLGLVGLPNVGKSTLFNALSGAQVLAANYPFATIEPNTALVPVPDERLAKLAELYNSVKTIPAVVEFVDIAGLVAGASKGEGLGNKFLSNIRECNAIVHVVRAFESPDILRHADAPLNPRSDIDIINTELILADIQTIENHIPKVQKLLKSDPQSTAKLQNLQFLQNELLAGKPVHQIKTESYDPNSLSDLQLLTNKPTIYVINVDEKTLTNPTKQQEILASTHLTAEETIFINAQLEAEISSLPPEEKAAFLQEYNIETSGLEQLAQTSYELLGLQSFLTAGPTETRAWTIKKGSTAPEAAGEIHTDFERGFIAAQVVTYQDLVKYGSVSAARSAGKIRTEGRDYVMQPDDVVEFRFNV